MKVRLPILGSAMSLVDVPPAPENVSDAVPEGTVAGLQLLAPLQLPVPTVQFQLAPGSA